VNTVYLSIGTNIGNLTENLKTCLFLLEKAGIKAMRLSGVYMTEPVGVKNQPDFNNICLETVSDMPPESMLLSLKAIEFEMGRIKGGHWGPRIIDIDILFYSNIIINSPALKIPHPEIANRRFVLEPLSELASEFKHPVLGMTIIELLNKGNFSEKCNRIGEL
jgi:2-amino-4-hydroxy-6-hydroxymethyldihydropteridine diphosphokinase